MTLTIGTKVRYRTGSEPHAFSLIPHAVHTIKSIRLVCNDTTGEVTHSYATLSDGTSEVLTIDLLAA